MSSLRGCKDAIDDFERSYFSPTCAKKGNECCKCGDTGCEGPVSSATGASSSSGYIATPTAAIVVAQGSSSSSGCITTPAAAITVAQESSSSSGCITTPVAAIFVVGTSSGTAVSTLPDSVVHTHAHQARQGRGEAVKKRRER